MKVCIHQPNYLPWLGFFHKIFLADVFVFLDHVQYAQKTWTNRAFICHEDRLLRLSIPVSLNHWDTPINQVVINTQNFSNKHLNSIYHAYGKCEVFDEVYALLEPHFSPHELTIEKFNISLIEDITAYLGWRTKFVRSSSLELSSKKNDLLIDIAKSVGADIFVSGVGAKPYIKGHEQKYEDNGIVLAYQSFTHPVYKQRSSAFQENASIIDALFNLGKNTTTLFSADGPTFVLAT